LLLIARPGCVLVSRTLFGVPLVMMKPPGEQAALLVAVTAKLLVFHVVLRQKVQNAELNFTAVRATPKAAIECQHRHDAGAQSAHRASVKSIAQRYESEKTET
jgi:hypothetical protein